MVLLLKRALYRAQHAFIWLCALCLMANTIVHLLKLSKRTKFSSDFHIFRKMAAEDAHDRLKHHRNVRKPMSPLGSVKIIVDEKELETESDDKIPKLEEKLQKRRMIIKKHYVNKGRIQRRMSLITSRRKKLPAYVRWTRPFLK